MYSFIIVVSRNRTWWHTTYIRILHSPDGLICSLQTGDRSFVKVEKFLSNKLVTLIWTYYGSRNAAPTEHESEITVCASSSRLLWYNITSAREFSGPELSVREPARHSDSDPIVLVWANLVSSRDILLRGAWKALEQSMCDVFSGLQSLRKIYARSLELFFCVRVDPLVCFKKCS